MIRSFFTTQVRQLTSGISANPEIIADCSQGHGDQVLARFDSGEVDGKPSGDALVILN